MNPIRDWNEFWFEPRNATPLGLFRIAIGLVAIMKLTLLLPFLNDFYSEQGMMALRESQWWPRLCVFDILPLNAAPVVFLITLVVAIAFTLGLWTRPMTVALYVLLLSINQRNTLVRHSGDMVMVMLLFFGMFAPLGATCSIDRLRAVYRGQAPPSPVKGSCWALRLMQLQICLMYFWTAFSKVMGSSWQSGEALYWFTRNLERGRWPLPSFLTETMWGINVLTYSTLFVEGFFPFLVWIPRVRPYMLFAGVLFHLGMEYTSNIQIFQFVILSAYLLFIDGDELAAAWARVRGKLVTEPAHPVLYDGACGFCSRSIRVLEAVDLFKRLDVVNFRGEAARQRAPDLDLERAKREILVRDRRGRWHGGFFAYRWMAWRLPLLWPIAPFLYLPGAAWLGTRVYCWIAAHRSSLSCPIPPKS